MAERVEIQFQAILSAVREQGERQASALEGLSAEIRDLAKSVVKAQGAPARNGAVWPYLLSVFSVLGMLLAPTWGGLVDLRGDLVRTREDMTDLVHLLRADVADTRRVHAEDHHTVSERQTRSEASLTEIETQFTCMGDIANLERQHQLRMDQMQQQCPNATIPGRDYWPLANVGRGDGAGKQ